MSEQIQFQESKTDVNLTAASTGEEVVLDKLQESGSTMPVLKFPITPIEELKDRPFPKTAACLVIGDEILNGKTVDTNSGFFAKFCFNLGIDMKRIEVIPDEEDAIIEAVRRLSKNFDFVVTSGGIGPTHDDITYPAIARAFNLELEYHEQTMERMAESMKNLLFLKKEPNHEIITARKRMALLPSTSLVVYPNETIWVPIVIVNDNVHILPGVPSLFRGLLSEFGKYHSQKGEKFVRIFVRTNQPESFIAPVLTKVQNKVADLGVKVGSYPKWTTDGKRWVMVSFLARETRKDVLEELAKEVAAQTNGYITENPDDEMKSKNGKF